MSMLGFCTLALKFYHKLLIFFCLFLLMCMLQQLGNKKICGLFLEKAMAPHCSTLAWKIPILFLPT